MEQIKNYLSQPDKRLSRRVDANKIIASIEKTSIKGSPFLEDTITKGLRSDKLNRVYNYLFSRDFNVLRHSIQPSNPAEILELSFLDPNSLYVLLDEMFEGKFDSLGVKDLVDEIVPLVSNNNSLEANSVEQRNIRLLNKLRFAAQEYPSYEQSYHIHQSHPGHSDFIRNRNMLRGEITAQRVSQGVEFNELPIIYSEEFDLRIYDLISRFLSTDLLNDGVVSLQKVLSLVLANTRVAYEDSLKRHEFSDDMAPEEQAILTEQTLENAARIWKYAIEAADRYIAHYQTVLNLNTLETQQVELLDIVVEDEFEFKGVVDAANEADELSVSVNVGVLNKRFETLVQVDDFIDRLSKEGSLPKFIYVPDGALLLKDFQPESEGGSFVMVAYRDHQNHRQYKFIPYEFNSTTKEIDYENTQVELANFLETIDKQNIETVILGKDHHTPDTYLIPNSSAQAWADASIIIKILKDCGYLSSDDEIQAYVEPVRFSDDDMGLAIVMLRFRELLQHEIYKGKDSASMHEKQVHDRAMEVINLESIIDTWINSLPHDHVFLQDKSILNWFEKYNPECFAEDSLERQKAKKVFDYILSYFDGRDDVDVEKWPRNRKQAWFNLVVSFLMKIELFKRFYQKINGDKPIVNAHDLKEAVDQQYSNVMEYTKTGFLDWWLDKIDNNNVNARDFIDSRIPQELSGEIYEFEIGGVQGGFSLIDDKLSSPEAPLVARLNRIVELAEGMDKDTPLFTQPNFLHKEFENTSITTTSMWFPPTMHRVQGQEGVTDEELVSYLVPKIAQLVGNRIFSLINARGMQFHFNPDISDRGGTRQAQGVEDIFDYSHYFETVIPYIKNVLEVFFEKLEQGSVANVEKFKIRERIKYLFERSVNKDELAHLTGILTIISQEVYMRYLQDHDSRISRMISTQIEVIKKEKEFGLID